MLLEVRDWPGIAGPLVHVPDPLSATGLVEEIASRVAPRYRVISVSPRSGVPYQVSATDLLGVLNQFGFENTVLVGEGLGCLTALVVAAWYPEQVGRLILVQPCWHASDNTPEGWALRDCPPDLDSLRQRVRCQVNEVSGAEQVVATLP